MVLCWCVVSFSTLSSCAFISVTPLLRLSSLCSQGQLFWVAPALKDKQPPYSLLRGLLLLLQPEDAKSDSDGGNKIGQLPRALPHNSWRIITIWKCVIKPLSYQGDRSKHQVSIKQQCLFSRNESVSLWQPAWPCCREISYLLHNIMCNIFLTALLGTLWISHVIHLHCLCCLKHVSVGGGRTTLYRALWQKHDS